jgi:hypothetical protein
MSNNSPTEQLASQFLAKVGALAPEIEPIRVLKARAYKIADASFLIRAATVGKAGTYFFGLNYINAEEVSNLENAFFIFICGSIERSVIIPSAVFVKKLSSISHDRNGEYKIIFDKNLNLALKGRNHRLDCSEYINAFHLLLNPPPGIIEKVSAEESFHSVLQGRLLEIGNVRGYHTFCPDKSKKFNRKPLLEIAALQTCPKLQFTEYDLLRQIDVLWFRHIKGDDYIPEYAFEVEISTGTWPGVGRMATLIEYPNTKLYVISNELKKFDKVMSVYPPSHQRRYKHVKTESVGELYAAELSLKKLRIDIGI